MQHTQEGHLCAPRLTCICICHSATQLPAYAFAVTQLTDASRDVELCTVRQVCKADAAGHQFDGRHTGTESILQFLQDFKNCMQSPKLTLCGKDENLLLGQVESIDAVDYKGLAPQVYDLLAARLWVCSSSTVHSEYA